MSRRSKKHQQKRENEEPEEFGPPPDETTEQWLQYYAEFNLSDHYCASCRCYGCRVARSWFWTWLENKRHELIEQQLKEKEEEHERRKSTTHNDNASDADTFLSGGASVVGDKPD